MGRKFKNCRRKRYKSEVYASIRCSSDNATIDISSYSFEITEESVKRLESYRQKSSGELCGIILGSTVGEKSYRINVISGICNADYSDKSSCVRDSKKANEIIAKEYISSNHTRVYMGEWHTHPEKFPRPSIVDIESVADIYATAELAIDGVLLCIVGLDEMYWGFYINGKLYDISLERS